MSQAQPSRIERVRLVFDEAVRLLPAQREGFVRARLTDAPDLLDDALRLLPYADDDAAPARERTAPPAPRIGRFQPLATVHSAGAGAVYEAIDAAGDGANEGAPGDPPRVALKVVPAPGRAGDAGGRLRREAALLRTLRGRGLPRLIEHGVCDVPGRGPVEYLATAWVEGERLDRWRARTAPDCDEAARLLATLCERVALAHARGVAHGDLKPANVLVGPDNEPTVLDWGAAAGHDSAGRANEADKPAADDAGRGPGATRSRRVRRWGGTPGYLAPERARTLGPPTARADVYALGVIAYELLAGVSPASAGARAIDGAQPAPAGPRAALRAEPAPLSRLAPEARGDLERIVHRALHEDRRARYAHAGAMGADLRRYLSGRPIEPAPAPFLIEARALVRRHPVASGVIAALALLLAASGTLLWRQSERTVAVQAQAIAARNGLLATLAQAAVDIDELLQAHPGPTPARTAAATRAMELLDSVARSAGDDAEVRLLVAESRTRLAMSLGVGWNAHLGRTDEALRELSLAITDLRDPALPRTARSSLALARALTLRWSANDDVDAQGRPITADLDEAGALLEPLLAGNAPTPGAADPAVARQAREVMTHQLVLRAMHRWRQDRPDAAPALTLLDRAALLASSLDTDGAGAPSPRTPELRARVWRHRAIVLREAGDAPGALDAAERAFATLDALARAEQPEAWASHQAASAEIELARTLAPLRPLEVPARVRAALERLDRVRRADPQSYPARRSGAVLPLQGAQALLDAAAHAGLAPDQRRALLDDADAMTLRAGVHIDALAGAGLLRDWEQHYPAFARAVAADVSAARRALDAPRAPPGPAPAR